MTANPLIIGPAERERLRQLRERAAAYPLDIPRIVKAIKTKPGMAKHARRMGRLSINLPRAFGVTFSIDIGTGHPAGPMRHASIRSHVSGRAPVPEAVWMICEALGFAGGLDQCMVWQEEIAMPTPGGIAINVA